MADDNDKLRINPDYVLGQLARALSSTSEGAADRARRWWAVLSGMLRGTLRIGSRTPIADVPAWVTTEVLHGGFASGALAAGGDLQPHETAKLVSIRGAEGTTDRASLNLYYVGDEGRAELSALLRDGRFRVHVPEEAALLVAAWLLEEGEPKRAEALLDEIVPFFDRLRFYPVPHPRPIQPGAGVHLQTAGDVATSLRRRKPNGAVARMNEALRVWTPMYDRAVALFLETVEGETPTLRTTDSGDLARGSDSAPVVDGGWPCKRFERDWDARASKLLADYEVARTTNRLCRKPERPKENFARLRSYLAKRLQGAGGLTDGDARAIRRILASFVNKHGMPGGERFRATRNQQALVAAKPMHASVAAVVADRLDVFAADEGVPELPASLGPLSAAEATSLGCAGGEPLPSGVVDRAMRCLDAPVESLVARKLVGSSEVLATLIPPVSARARASGIADPDLRRVYEAVYKAFRRRRSLLLLDLESQARLGELPWIAAIGPWVGGGAESRQAARNTLAMIVRLAIETFPQTILPNKLVKELRALARGAGDSVPLVEELAADIFTGEFSGSFLLAAKAAGRFLRGSLYERYYGLPFQRVLELNDLEERQKGVTVSSGFAILCKDLARADTHARRSVASNGTIIEQSQILTTHNLAALFECLNLTDSIRTELPRLARRCFEFCCRGLRLRTPEWRLQLHEVKNAAYAWRQMLFFLSLSEAAEVGAFLAWSDNHLARQAEELRTRMAPLLVGLRAVVGGSAFGFDGIEPETGGRRFLGWSTERHWLLPGGRSTAVAR